MRHKLDEFAIVHAKPKTFTFCMQHAGQKPSLSGLQG